MYPLALRKPAPRVVPPSPGRVFNILIGLAVSPSQYGPDNMAIINPIPLADFVALWIGELKRWQRSIIERRETDIMSETRNVAILSGCDWYDASVEFVTVPAGLDLEQAKKDWREYYNNDYLPALYVYKGFPTGTAVHPKYFDFKEWLQVNRGGADWDCETFDYT